MGGGGNEGLTRGRSYYQLCQIRIQTFPQKGIFVHKHCPSVSDIHNSEGETEKHLYKNVCKAKIQFIRGCISDIWSINSMLLFEEFNKYFMGSICTKIIFFFWDSHKHTLDASLISVHRDGWNWTHFSGEEVEGRTKGHILVLSNHYCISLI